MKKFKIDMNVGDQKFIVSYRHPLTQIRTRQSFTDQDDAQKHKEELKRKFECKDILFSRYEELTIEELLIYFVKEAPNKVFSPGQMHFIDFFETFGGFRLCEVTPKELKNWIDQVQKENSLKDITAKGLKSKLNTFFNFLKDREIISESPLSTLYYNIKTKPLNSRNVLLPHEIKSLMKSLKEYSPGYLYPIIRMFSETAAKSKELVELTWKQVDLEKKLVSFPKGERVQERTLEISDELVEMLRLKTRGENPDLQKKVFLTYYKEPFTGNKLRRAVLEFRQKGHYKGKDWVIGDLRHSFAVNFLTQGGNMRELQRILGHWNVYETKKLYGKAAKDRITKEVIDPFE